MKKIYIGAGHSNTDSGAASYGVTEAEIVTDFRNLLTDFLRELGCEVVTDGNKQENLSLKNAIFIAKQVNGPRLEFHLNAASNPNAKGVEILSLPKHKALAQKVAAIIASTLEIPLRGELGWKSDSEGQHHRLGFCREGDGLVVELFFITNKKELDTYIERKNRLANNLCALLAREIGITG